MNATGRRVLGIGITGLVIALSVAWRADAGQDRFTSEDTRLTMGAETVNPSSGDRSQHFLVDFMLTAPLDTHPVTRTDKPALGAWLNARFNGTATDAVNGVQQFVGGFEDTLVSGNTSDVFNALTLRAGVEFGPRTKWSFNFGDHYQFQVLGIAAAGFTTPAPSSGEPPLFEMTEQARARFVPEDVPGRATFTYIGFVVPDRQRFYGSWETGLRLKTHHFDCTDDACAKRVNFPGLIDITVGQNEAVTGGVRRGLVMSLDGFYPLPVDNRANAVYLFGAARLQRVKALDGLVERDPVILKGAATVQLPSAAVYLHTLTHDERTRDDWRLGVAVDLIRLFTPLQSSSTASQPASAAPQPAQ